MTQYYRMCRYSQDILPISEFTIDQWDCDRVCHLPPFGPKSVPKETSYTIRKPVENETKVVKEGFNPHDEPAWRALFNVMDADRSGKIGVYEMYAYLERIAGRFDWDDDGDGEMDFNEFVVAMTTKLSPSTEMAIKLYAHSLIGNDLTQKTSYPTERRPSGQAKKTDSFTRAGSAHLAEDDKQALLKLFHHIDTSGSGRLDRNVIQDELTQMLGSFEWKDDGDGSMDPDEFLEAMRHVSPSTRLTAVMYAKTCI